MTKSNFYFALLLLAGLVIASCEKKEELPEYPVKMTFDSVEPTSEMQIFTSEGRLPDNGADATVIADFLDRDYWIGNTWYNSAFREADEEIYQESYRKTGFTFYGDGRIDYSAVTEITDITRIDDVLLLQTPFTNKVEDNPLGTSGFFRYPFKTTPDGSRYHTHYVVRSDGQSELEVPLLCYKLVRYDESGKLTSVDFGIARNELDQAFIQTLGENDTLAVKTYKMSYSAK